MSTWNDIKRHFRDALINAFNRDSLAIVLRYHCNRRLDRITSKSDGFDKNVDDVIAHAEQNSWLDKLAAGALAENALHTGLEATVPHILAGVKAEGKAYYQPSADHDPPAGQLDPRLRPYLEWMAQHSERLALSLLDPSGGKTARLELAKVFINLNATPREWALPEKEMVIARERAALAAVHAERQLILLGDPGSGKSTLLRFLVLCLASEALEPQAGWLQELKWNRELLYRLRGGARRDDEVVETENHHWTIDAPLPVLVEMRDFASTNFDPHSPLALWNYIERQLSGRGMEAVITPLAAQAQAGNVILLLDGVDEVPTGRRKDVWQAISSLAEGVYASCRWVASCRILSFDASEATKGVQERTLQPLTKEHIKEFIGRWYRVLEEMGELSSARAENLTSHLQKQTQGEALQELARNPMLLTIMAIVQTYYGTLPEERARLYQACVETLLLRWQMPKESAEEGKALPDMLAALGVNQQKLERLLWEIAWQAHSEAVVREERADIKESEIMALAAKHLGGYNKAEQFLTYTEQRAHLLVGRGGLGERVYSFPHRTFQEYLAACYLTPGIRLPKQAPQLAEYGDTWREVLNLASGALVYNNNNFEQVLFAVERMIPHELPTVIDSSTWYRIWLAGEMAAVVGRQNFEESDFAEELLPRLREQLVALLEHAALIPQQRAEAGDSLGKLGDPRPGVGTLEPELIEIVAGEFLYGDEKKTYAIERPFTIARYPVTVAQFAEFVVDGGYERARYWGGHRSAGWRWRLSEHNVEYRGEGPITQPQYWKQLRWHVENRPVVGVSWYEAQAYCAWLTEHMEREYRLPTDVEWERAARHTDGRLWPWGNDWSDGIINSQEAQIHRTTAVGSFPRSAAECGVDDMGGNVLEWMASSHYSDPHTILVRGGSWLYSRENARAEFFGSSGRDLSYYNVGFRLVSSVF